MAVLSTLRNAPMQSAFASKQEAIQAGKCFLDGLCSKPYVHELFKHDEKLGQFCTRIHEERDWQSCVAGNNIEDLQTLLAACAWLHERELHIVLPDYSHCGGEVTGQMFASLRGYSKPTNGTLPFTFQLDARYQLSGSKVINISNCMYTRSFAVNEVPQGVVIQVKQPNKCFDGEQMAGFKALPPATSKKNAEALQSAIKERAVKLPTATKEPAAVPETAAKETATKRPTATKEPAAVPETAAKETATKRPTGTKEPAAVPETAAKETATKRPTATKEPAAVPDTAAKETATKRPTATKEPAAVPETAAKETATKRATATKELAAVPETAAKETATKPPTATQILAVKAQADTQEPAIKLQAAAKQSAVKSNRISGSRPGILQVHTKSRSFDSSSSKSAAKPGAAIPAVARSLSDRATTTTPVKLQSLLRPGVSYADAVKSERKMISRR